MNRHVLTFLLCFLLAGSITCAENEEEEFEEDDSAKNWNTTEEAEPQEQPNETPQPTTAAAVAPPHHNYSPTPPLTPDNPSTTSLKRTSRITSPIPKAVPEDPNHVFVTEQETPTTDTNHKKPRQEPPELSKDDPEVKVHSGSPSDDVVGHFDNHLDSEFDNQLEHESELNKNHPRRPANHGPAPGGGERIRVVPQQGYNPFDSGLWPQPSLPADAPPVYRALVADPGPFALLVKGILGMLGQFSNLPIALIDPVLRSLG